MDKYAALEWPPSGRTYCVAIATVKGRDKTVRFGFLQLSPRGACGCEGQGRKGTCNLQFFLGYAEQRSATIARTTRVRKSRGSEEFSEISERTLSACYLPIEGRTTRRHGGRRIPRTRPREILRFRSPLPVSQGFGTVVSGCGCSTLRTWDRLGAGRREGSKKSRPRSEFPDPKWSPLARSPWLPSLLHPRVLPSPSFLPLFPRISPLGARRLPPWMRSDAVPWSGRSRQFRPFRGKFGPASSSTVRFHPKKIFEDDTCQVTGGGSPNGPPSPRVPAPGGDSPLPDEEGEGEGQGFLVGDGKVRTHVVPPRLRDRQGVVSKGTWFRFRTGPFERTKGSLERGWDPSLFLNEPRSPLGANRRSSKRRPIDTSGSPASRSSPSPSIPPREDSRPPMPPFPYPPFGDQPSCFALRSIRNRIDEARSRRVSRARDRRSERRRRCRKRGEDRRNREQAVRRRQGRNEDQEKTRCVSPNTSRKRTPVVRAGACACRPACVPGEPT
eukprot:scaffold2639_cov361-Pavlova_lutheri.AAC.43